MWTPHTNKYNMLKEFKRKTVYVLDNEQGDIPVGTIAIIAIAIVVGLSLTVFRDKLIEVIEQAGKRLDEWKGKM